MKTDTINAEQIAGAIDQIVSDIAVAVNGDERLAVIGIANGGIPFGQKLAAGLSAKLGRDVPAGNINMTFHRDDVRHNPIPGVKSRTVIPLESIEGATIVLTDDVIHSGRTVRAALNELFDLGRPARVCLAVLCDRGLRRLPIQPDFTGMTLDTAPEQKVKVSLDTENPSNDIISVV